MENAVDMFRTSIEFTICNLYIDHIMKNRISIKMNVKDIF